jgi:hypothetical protein
MSNILFIGDSFTWGQGLYFYKWKEQGRKLPDSVGGIYPSHAHLVTEDDIKYKDDNSFTGLVSSYYGLEQNKRVKNGGSNTDLILDMIPMIDKLGNNIDKLVFQFTTISRYQFRDLNMGSIENCEGTFEDVYKQRVTNFFNYVDETIGYFSKLYNFKYCYMDWLGDFYKESPDKFVKYKIDGMQHNYFGEFLDNYKIDLVVDDKPIIDLHLNKDGQKVISNSIISHFGTRKHS